MAIVKALRFDPRDLRYRALIGVGGIGSGVFFAIRGNETVGREESRLGRFLDRRDYCKLHIIAHYVATLLGPDFVTMPVGRVGDDPTGQRLLREMVEAGIETRFVKVARGYPTLHSFCFLYPDGAGGNLTTEDSACSRIDARALEEAAPEFDRFLGEGIALAAPEVPLSARAALLDLGRSRTFFNVAAFSSEEILPALENGLLNNVDLLGMNRHEAATLTNLPAEEYDPERIFEAAIAVLDRHQPGMLVSVTAGAQGSWVWNGRRATHRPALRVAVRSAAGAGDAHLAGLIAGLSAGMTPDQAHELASLLASFTVTSPHTIHPDVSRSTLREFACGHRAALSPEVSEMLQEQTI
ncbi:MAG: carbohydrate kinase family protein [Acidobacteria bacterium]|nr:MAG: carbohydrate kinase family protein [Acidobacteriota bacterium]